MIQKNITLNEWAVKYPSTNPFLNCINITDLGGADLYWDEFKYRYGEREVFKENELVAAIERVFRFNKYKYERLLDTTLQEYDMFTNYKLSKDGSEITTFDTNDAHRGTDTRTPNLSKARTDNLSESTTTTPGVSETITETPTLKTKETVTPTVKTKETVTPTVKTKETVTPTVKTKETVTPTVKTKETVTPTVKTKETDTKGTVTTTTVTPEGYVDETSRTTFDSANYNAVQKDTHTVTSNSTTTVTPSGAGDTKVTEILSGDTITESEVISGNTVTENETVSGNTITENETVSGNTITEKENVSGNTITEHEIVSGNTMTTKTKNGFDTFSKSNTGTSTLTETGTDTTQYNSTMEKTGTESLGFENRVDSGYMYREPQNAIKDEREIAVFAILNDILSDCEQATLLSIYL